MIASPSYIVWFDEPGGDDRSRVGGKGANLARLVAAGFTVPPGFCVTAEAYGRFVSVDGLQDRILAEMDGATALAGIERSAGRVRSYIAAQAVPEEIATRIAASYERLGGDVPVAVRSSATAEDLPEASFAGQQDTYLNVTGAESVLDHVRRCWASLWTDRAVSYRAENGYRHDAVQIAVVVQAMVQPSVAGVLFTANPLTGRRDQAVVNASYGLGEAVVSGRVTPDTFTVSLREAAILERHLGDKDVEIVSVAPGSVEERPVEAARASAQCLSDDQVIALVRLGARVTEHYGAPQDIEWGLVDGQFLLLQCRPITTLPERAQPDAAEHYSRAMFTEILPEAPSPSFCSVLEPVLGSMLTFTFARLGQEPPLDVPRIGVFYHQPYLNLRFIDGALAGLPEASRAQLRGRVANPFADHSGEPAPGRPSLAELGLALRLVREARRLPREIHLVVDCYYRALRRYESIDLARLDDRALVADLRTVAIDLLTPLVEYDFLLIAVLGVLQRALEAIVARSGAGDPRLLRGLLMSGVTGNVTMETNKALWQLARVARNHPDVASAIAAAPDAAIVDRVHAADSDGAFGASLDEFLSVHGHREAHMDIVAPTWGEDPAPVLRFVRTYLAAPQSADPADQERAAARRRAEVESDVRDGLGRSLSGRLVARPLFGAVLRTVEALAAQRDTMHYHWTSAFPVIRRMVLELGARLAAAGHLDTPQDAFMLELADIERLASEPRDVRDLAARRRRAWEADRHGPWPVEIRYGEDVYDAPALVPESGRALAGVPGSPGRARGPVRIVRGPDAFGSLREGEILVAPLTNPVWTPLFAVASAVVTDAGGILSHGAIVAREYGIPAVMGVGVATTTLRDGEIVTVDGTRGTVVPDEAQAQAALP